MNRLHYVFFVRRKLKDLSAREGIPLRELCGHYWRCYFAKGFKVYEYTSMQIYRYSCAEARKFLSVREMRRIQKQLNAGATAEERNRFHEKHSFDASMADFIRREWLYLPESTEQQVRDFFRRNGKGFVKPIAGSMGDSARVVTSESFDIKGFMENYGREQAVLESIICQHPDMASLNPSSVNTIRIQTARKGKRVHIVGCILRIGGSGAIVDNFHNGGCAFPVDAETGVVTGAGCLMEGPCNVLKSSSTGRTVVGFQIPYWDKILETVHNAALVPEHFGYMGWDVAVTPEGPELVEVNLVDPDNIVLQIGGRSVGAALFDFMKQNDG